MTSASSVSYRSETVGSLLRPAYLKEAVAQHAAGALSAEALAAVQDRAVLEAIALQEACDLDVVTDGEMRRRGWTDPLTRGLAGYSREPLVMSPNVAGQAPADIVPRLPGVVSRLGPGVNVPLQETAFLRQHTRRPCKATLPSLSYASVLWAPGISDRAYPDRAEYMQDALRLVREQVAELAASGITYVQLDAPRYTHLVSEAGLENFRRLGLDTRTWLGEMIALDNALMADFPQVTFGLHLCRGNSRSMWAVEGGYDPIAEQLFNDLKVQRLLLEYDTPRAGTFAPLRFVPADKVVVLGLITTKTPEIESAATLQARVQEAAQHVPLERLALSPQCGFASTLEGNLISEDVQRAKLERLGQVAKEIWR
jgi:5-methyltetrahydropteroyltriglutamate--homocysteine methyltransferase